MVSSIVYLLHTRMFGIVVFAAVLSGCGAPSEPQPTAPAAKDLSTFYTPRSTTTHLWYSHHDFRGAGYPDSVYVISYLGVLQTQTADGFGPVDQYWISDGTLLNGVPLKTYVSDSVVVEYGANEGTLDHRIVRLCDSLRVNYRWIAANNFVTPQGQSVLISAYTDQYLESLVVSAKPFVSYGNIYQVNDTIHNALATPNAEYQEGSWRAIYYAQNYGKVLENCFKPQSNILLWSDQLDSVTTRN
jgi:hypothetical protein